jgi:hypothetical protein
MVSWNMPEDRPATTIKEPKGLNPRRIDDIGERENLEQVMLWLESDDKEITHMTCILLENVVEGLVNGGRYLYGWANGNGGDAPKGQGMPELELLTECNIDCFVSKSQPRSKGRDIPITLKGTTLVQQFVGYDEEERTRRPRTIGPRQSGAPADIIITAGPSWIFDMTERQREMALFNALVSIVPDEKRYLNPWKAIAPDIVINSATLEIYGDESEAATAALQASKRHIQTFLPGMTQPEQDAVLEKLLRERGMSLYKDGRVINPDGTVMSQVETEDEE